jgi:hypothetical protein
MREMGESLHSFFLLDDKARWRAFLWSWLIGTAVGTAGVFGGASTPTIATLTLWASFLSFGGFLVTYASRRQRPPIRHRRAFIDFAYAGTAAAILVVVERLFNNPDVVHAAATNIVDAVKANYSVSPAQIATIGSKVEALLTRGGQPQAIRRELVADHARLKAMAFIKSSSPEKTLYPAPESAYVTYSFPVPIKSGAAIDATAIASRFLFAGFIYTTDVRTNLLVKGNLNVVGFAHVIVKNFSQKLDSATWIDVRFEGCLIEYDGGPLILVDVLFVDCSFVIADNVSSSVRSTLTTSNIPVTFSSDYSV